MSLKNLFSCEITTPKSAFIEKKTKLSQLYDKQKVLKNEINQIDEEIEELIKQKQETINKTEEITKEIIKTEEESKNQLKIILNKLKVLELISPSPDNIMFDELKPRRRTLSETNDIFPEKKSTPKKSPNFPTSTKSYNDFSYKVKKK